MCDRFIENKVRVISGDTDNHLMLVDVKKSFGITGEIAEKVLDSICITVNKNAIPYDTEPPKVTSGLRIGTPAMTTRGFTEKEFETVAEIIIKALKKYQNEEVLKRCKEEVLNLTKKYPLKNIK